MNAAFYKGEVWRDIPGEETKLTRYQVSSEGRVRSVNKASGQTHIKVPYTTHASQCVRLSTRSSHTVMRLVATAFYGEIPAGIKCEHINGDYTDNRLSNIRLVKTVRGIIEAGRKKRKPVVKLDADGNVVDIYRTITEAARANYYSISMISIACHKKRKCNGYYYSFDEPRGRGGKSMTDTGGAT